MASRKSRRGINSKNIIPLKKTSASRTQSDSVNYNFDYTESDDEPFDEKATKKSFRVRKNKETKLTKANKIKNDSIDVSTCSSEKSASKQASMIAMIAKGKKSLKRKTKICLKSETDVRDSAMRKEKKETTAQRKFAPHEEQDEEMNDQNDIDDKANLTLRKTDSLKFSTNSQGHVSSQQNQNATIADTPIRSCPLCAAEFSGDTTEEELNRHVNSCLDSKTQAPPYEPVTQNRLSICPNERSANLEVSNNELKDEELAKALQNRELEKISEENLTNELFFCSLCEKDLSRLNAATREVHMNKCADVVERETMQIQKAKRKSLQESSKEFECLICCMQFSTMQLRISHMKQCCESHKVDRRELLYVVRSEQNSRQSLADSNKDESQGQNLKTVNDMLKMPHSNAVNRIEGKVTEGSLKPERKKRIQRKKIRNQEVPVILLRSEDEAKQIANQRATKLIEEQLCLQDGVKENPGSCLPPSSLASKYKCRKRKVKDFDKTSQDLAEPIRITSQPTKRVQAFGIRKVAKRQMAGKMREIYKMQHGFQHWEEPPPKAQRKTKQKKTKADVNKRKAGSAKGKVVPDDKEEEDQSSSSSNDEGRMTFEGGNCSDDDTSSQSSRTDEQNKGSLVEKLLKFIKSNKVWYQKVLTYQKLNLDDFIKAVKEAGIKCSSKRLKDFLDEQCICFVCPRDDDKPRRKKRRRNPNK